MALGGCFGNQYDDASRSAEGDDVGEPGDTDTDGDFDRDDCKLEGSAIGTEGVTLALGDRVVTLTDWVVKGDSPGDFVGFSLSVSDDGGVGYVVKTGGQLWASSDSTWLHPDGTEGPEAPGISNIDFCEECEDGSCDDGGDGECNDPDGCDNDGGGECRVDEDCPAGEFCESGGCLPVVL